MFQRSQKLVLQPRNTAGILGFLHLCHEENVTNAARYLKQTKIRFLCSYQCKKCDHLWGSYRLLDKSRHQTADVILLST